MSKEYVEHGIETMIKNGETKDRAVSIMRTITFRKLQALSFEHHQKLIDQVIEDLNYIDELGGC